MTDRHLQIEQHAARWLARRDAAAWGAAQQAALDAWLGEDTAHRVAFLRLDAAWRAAARLRPLAAVASQRPVPERGAWAHSPYFASPIAAPDVDPADPVRTVRTPKRWLLLATVAASLLVVLVAGGLWWREATRVELGSWRTPLGVSKAVHLADGSTATLASDTELRTALSRHERDLYLARGEAFFDVAHDPSRPFVVHVDHYRVIAVGTRFDVRRDTDGLRVVVTRGLVRLQSTQSPGLAATALPAGSVASVTGDSIAVQQVPLNEARDELTWRRGYVVFHETPLAQAVDAFNRFNGRRIVIADPSLDNLKVGGNFRLDNSAAFVRLLQAIFPVRAISRGDIILLSRRTARARH